MVPSRIFVPTLVLLFVVFGSCSADPLSEARQQISNLEKKIEDLNFQVIQKMSTRKI